MRNSKPFRAHQVANAGDHLPGTDLYAVPVRLSDGRTGHVKVDGSTYIGAEGRLADRIADYLNRRVGAHGLLSTVGEVASGDVYFGLRAAEM